MYNVSRAAHRIEDYGPLIPAANHERFRDYYRWSKRRRARFVTKMEALLADPRSRAFVAVKGDDVLGYVLAAYEAPDHLTLKGLFVRPRHQGQGVGASLMEYLLSRIAAGTNVRLSVVQHNSPAIRLYERFGFRFNSYEARRFYGARQQRMMLMLT